MTRLAKDLHNSIRYSLVQNGVQGAMVYADDLAGELELSHERVVLRASHDEGHGRHAGHGTPESTLHNIHKLVMPFASENLTLIHSVLQSALGLRKRVVGGGGLGRIVSSRLRSVGERQRG